MKSYGERTKKLRERIHRSLLKSGTKGVPSIMVGIDGLVSQHFISGLRPEIRQMVRYEGAESFEEAFEIALRREMSLEEMEMDKVKPADVPVVCKPPLNVEVVAPVPIPTSLPTDDVVAKLTA